MVSPFNLPSELIGVALVIDYALGDPRWLPHPVRIAGRVIAAYDRQFRSGIPSRDLWAGGILAAIVVGGGALGCYLLIRLLTAALGSVVGCIASVYISFTTLAVRGLDDAAHEVAQRLADDDLDGARRALPALVGRDPWQLDREGIIRATVESLGENCSDAIIAPLFYLFIGGPVAAVAYKMVNTLDSMVGYLNNEYRHLGRISARLDDFANLLPARIAALAIATAAAARRSSFRALKTALRFGRCHLSPNAGYPEAALAGALGVQLGGGATYDGEFEARPLLGTVQRPLTVADIHAARTLVRNATVITYFAFALAKMAITMGT